MEDAEGEAEPDDEDMEGELDQELLANEDSEEDAEGEEDDEDEDEEMQDHHPPPPVIKQDRAPGKAKPNVTVTAPSEGPLKSVEDKEMEDDDDDEELSELDSNEDAEGEEEEEEEQDSDEDDDNSRSATPDLTKLTKRQRGGTVDDFGGALMALPNEAQKKKHLTAEEHAMRRAEMARRRKNLSEKRNEEEKVNLPSIPDPVATLLTRTRWIPSTSCYQSQHPNAAPEQKLKPLVPQKKRPTPKATIQIGLIRHMSAGRTTARAAL